METEFVIQIIILFIVVYLALFKSYLTEKGKSAALKEDLQELTHEVESVKNKFTQEQEVLKVELQRFLNIEVSFRNEERAALIQFHGTISEWLYSILSVNLWTYNKTNFISLISIRNEVNSFYATAGIAKSKVELLVEEQILVSLARRLYIETLKFHQWSDIELFKIQQISESQKSLTDRFFFMKQFDKSKELAAEMAQEEKDLEAKAKEVSHGYLINRKKKYAEIVPIEQDFTIQVKVYLKT